MSESTAEIVARRTDPRVLRTRALLRAAALELAAERELHSITIANVAERATVNRATVYQHYQDLDELMLDAMEDELAGLIGLAARCPLVVLPAEMPQGFLDMFRHVETEATLYRRMLGPCGSPRFVNRLRQLVAEQVALQLVEAGAGRADEAGVELRAHCSAGAFIGLVTCWLLRPDWLPAEEAAAYAWQGLHLGGGKTAG
ncbi:TetR-like C-terminal domain-containing protein [Streptomyces sp. NBC_00827]|uniref:TetR-like C-terminal domain-containing protein n=1 Tax=Streptomyces sp. NBC_00827 TaxID=2903677 RepID=UPI00386A1198|nr:TetR/AcrR family transcriptional regulator [Streptomyces sp. NBC_00827]